MSDKEKDPPLADKPKLSSLTDFELKALKLQKEGKLDELNKEIEAIGKSNDEEKKPEPARDESKASIEELKSYDNLLKKINNPVPLDRVPAGVRKEIEQGMALLKEIVSDKERFEAYKKAFNEIGRAHV